jgi:hypothetical protein
MVRKAARNDDSHGESALKYRLTIPDLSLVQDSDPSLQWPKELALELLRGESD